MFVSPFLWLYKYLWHATVSTQLLYFCNLCMLQWYFLSCLPYSIISWSSSLITLGHRNCTVFLNISHGPFVSQTLYLCHFIMLSILCSSESDLQFSRRMLMNRPTHHQGHGIVRSPNNLYCAYNLHIIILRFQQWDLTYHNMQKCLVHMPATFHRWQITKYDH